MNTSRFVVLALWMVPAFASVSAQTRTPIISAVDTHVGAPPAVVSIAGREHLVYELHVTNFRPSAITLTRVEVVDARDDIPESPSLEGSRAPIALENASSNYVSLDLGDGRYAFYEHLKHGSIRVKSGDRVKTGDVIALLGNSGSSSSGPHLHFHVADADADLAGEGLPFVFSSFETVGTFDDINAFTTGERWKAVPSDMVGIRRGELPAPNSVIVFPRADSGAAGRSGRIDDVLGSLH